MNVFHLSAEVEHAVSAGHILQARNKVGGKVTRRETARPADTRCDCGEPSVLQACSSCPCRLGCFRPPVMGELQRLARREF